MRRTIFCSRVAAWVRPRRASAWWTLAICAYASTITVTTTNDSGPGSLRQALVDANDGDTITFAVTGTIGLTSGELAWRQHDGGHEDRSNMTHFVEWANRLMGSQPQ